MWGAPRRYVSRRGLAGHARPQRHRATRSPSTSLSSQRTNPSEAQSIDRRAPSQYAIFVPSHRSTWLCGLHARKGEGTHSAPSSPPLQTDGMPACTSRQRTRSSAPPRQPTTISPSQRSFVLVHRSPSPWHRTLPPMCTVHREGERACEAIAHALPARDQRVAFAVVLVLATGREPAHARTLTVLDAGSAAIVTLVELLLHAVGRMNGSEKARHAPTPRTNRPPRERAGACALIDFAMDTGSNAIAARRRIDARRRRVQHHTRGNGAAGVEGVRPHAVADALVVDAEAARSAAREEAHACAIEGSISGDGMVSTTPPQLAATTQAIVPPHMLRRTAPPADLVTAGSYVRPSEATIDKAKKTTRRPLDLMFPKERGHRRSRHRTARRRCPHRRSGIEERLLLLCLRLRLRRCGRRGLRAELSKVAPRTSVRRCSTACSQRRSTGQGARRSYRPSRRSVGARAPGRRGESLRHRRAALRARSEAPSLRAARAPSEPRSSSLRRSRSRASPHHRACR
jgi:hypothetical protein